MAHPAQSGGAARPNAALLADELAAAESAAATVPPILRHLLRSDDNSVFSDEIIARVRGMFLDVARQLIIALAEAAGQAEPEAWSHQAADELAHALADNSALLKHCHTLALEWQWTERLAQRRALDPVLAPILKARVSSDDPQVSAAAMNLLAAQARFCQNQRRMLLPLAELPSHLFHIALVTMRSFAGCESPADVYALTAERSIRSRFDEARGRLGLMGCVLEAMGEKIEDALTLDQAGIALFLTALARGSGQTREAMIMGATDNQLLRLALALRASGLSSEAAAAQALALHPDGVLPAGFETLERAAAAALLANAANVP